uniref:Reverse transcriptase domain-containing protein n=1 Tax=Tanacetum cinerariifolium TaxID=118510 RepID=A0A699R0G5_TANCI|nr:reverse transcriptase domain-containing protein [Tanacetum cinerariifolium]
MQAARNRQKSYADLKLKPMEFQVGDKVMLKVSPWKKGRTLWQTGEVKPYVCWTLQGIRRSWRCAYKLNLPKELSKSS